MSVRTDRHGFLTFPAPGFCLTLLSHYRYLLFIVGVFCKVFSGIAIFRDVPVRFGPIRLWIFSFLQPHSSLVRLLEIPGPVRSGCWKFPVQSGPVQSGPVVGNARSGPVVGKSRLRMFPRTRRRASAPAHPPSCECSHAPAVVRALPRTRRRASAPAHPPSCERSRAPAVVRALPRTRRRASAPTHPPSCECSRTPAVVRVLPRTRRRASAPAHAPSCERSRAPALVRVLPFIRSVFLD